MSEVKLDARDRRLLFELGLDSRQSLTALAGKLRMSKEAVHYRLQKLIEQGVILKLFAQFDSKSFGFNNYAIYLKLEGMPSTLERELHSFIEKTPYSAWLGVLAGRFDLVIRIHVKNVRELDSFLISFLSKFGRYVREKQITLRTAQNYFLAPLEIFSEFNPPKTHTNTSFLETTEADDVDIKLLTALYDNSRSTFVDLAEKAGISEETAKFRVQSLLKRKVITGFSCYLDRRKLRLSHYKVFLQFQYPTSERVQSLIEWCENHSSISFIVKCIGPWDLEADFDTHSPEDFNEILKNLRDEFRDLIADHSWVLVTQEKLLYWP